MLPHPTVSTAESGSLLVGRGIALVLFAFLLALAGCDGSGEPDLPGVILGQVTGEGTPLSAVTVELAGPVNRVVETDPQGRYRFEAIPTGAYVVSVRNLPPDAAFAAVSRTATVTSGSTVNLDFQGSFIRTASISGRVVARDRGVSGVTVTLAGPDVSSVQSGTDGSFSFPALRAGSYEVELSDIPSSASFPVTRVSVNLQPGQAREVRFEGEPALTASAAIQGIQRVLPDGSRVPADPRNLEGLVEVAVALDRGTDRVDSLVVSLGGQVVGVQRFSDVILPDPSEVLPALVSLAFPIATDAFHPATGVPRHLNGEQALSIRLASREGGPDAFSASTLVTLANSDNFVTTLLPGRGPIPDAAGAPWIGGALDVQVLPIVYTAGRSVNQVVLELRRQDGALVARSGAVGTAPLLVRFPGTGTEAAALTGYVTPPGTTDRLTVVQARYADGTLAAGLPRTTAEGIRLDQVAPRVEAFRLPQQGAGRPCCLGNWVGAEARLTDGLFGLVDDGVGGITVRIHAGAASLTDEALLALPPVERGGDLPPSAGNSAYRAIAVLEDALGQRRTVSLEPSPGNPLTGTAGALFGVDLVPPVAERASGPGILPAFATAPQDGASWVVTVTDPPGSGPGVTSGGSGLGPSPLLASIVRFGPGDPPSGTCVFPGVSPESGRCEAGISGLVRPLPSGTPPGYLRFRAQGVDRAGNVSAPLEAWALVDDTPPAVGSLLLAGTPQPGGPAILVGEVSDAVDLFRARGLAVFRDPAASGSVGGEGITLPVMAPVSRIGTPFDGDPVRAASVQIAFPWIRGVQRSDGGADDQAPAGAMFPLSALRLVVEDAAGNLAARDLSPVPSVGPALLGFGADARGEDGVGAWQVRIARDQICRAPGGPGIGGNDGTPPPPCPAGSAGPLPLEAEAAMLRTGGAAPFVAVAWMAIPASGAPPRWIAQASDALAAEAGGVSRHTWALAWTPPDDMEPGTWVIRAVGWDAQGNALLTGAGIPLELRVGTP